MSRVSQAGKSKPGKGKPKSARDKVEERSKAARPGSLRRRIVFTSLALWAGMALLLGLMGTAQGAIDPFQIGRSSSLRGLAFLRPASSGSELWFIGVNELRPRRVAEQVLEYDVSPSGARLVYTTKQDATLTRLELLDLAAGTSRTLFADPAIVPARPAWSPADGIIAYERRAVTDTGLGTPKVWLMQPDGTSLGPALDGGDVMGYNALWSPNGTQLVASDTLRDEMLLFNFTSTVERIPALGEADWSPDGKRLVISTRRQIGDDEINQLAIYDVATKQLIPLPADQPVRGDDTPRWSPDGTQIAFIRRTEAEPLGNIWLLPVDAAGQSGPARRVTSDSKEIANEDPIWSPDGRVLMWSRFTVSATATPPSTWQIDVSKPDAVPAMVVEHGTNARWIP